MLFQLDFSSLKSSTENGNQTLEKRRKTVWFGLCYKGNETHISSVSHIIYYPEIHDKCMTNATKLEIIILFCLYIF